MIRVNLLPHPTGEPSASVLADFPLKSVGILLLIFCIGASAILAVAGQLQAGALRRLTAQWQDLQPQLRQLEATEAAIRALTNRAKVHQMLKAPEAQWAPRLNLLSDSIVSQLWFTSLRFEPPKPVKSALPAAAVPKAVPPKSAKASSKPPAKPNPEPMVQPPVTLVLEGSALVATAGAGAPVSRYLQRLKEQPAFSKWFREVELKSVEQRQVQQEQVSDFVMAFHPTGQ